MPEYVWNADKNEWLRRQRRISFDDVKYHLATGDLLGDIPNPNQERYPGQRLYIVRINNRTWAVPYRQAGDYIFLYTAYPSKKFTRMYRDELRGDHER